jgi:hypothetical protein
VRLDHNRKAEDIYMGVFGVACEYADHLQPDEDGNKYYLPIGIPEALAATLLLAAAKGIFGQIGKELYGKIKEVLFEKTKLKACPDKDLIEYLATKIPDLHLAARGETGCFQAATEII